MWRFLFTGRSSFVTDLEREVFRGIGDRTVYKPGGRSFEFTFKSRQNWRPNKNRRIGMIGGLIKSNRFAALAGSVLLAGGLAVSPAQAADFGGDCCADLEERVAVLEATTARKGNRKVSLTISGFVTQQIMVWDNGTEDDAYVGSNVNDLSSRVNFDGSAKINSEWSAGYSIRISVMNSSTTLASEDDDDIAPGLVGVNNLDSSGDRLYIEHNYLWVKNERLGKIGIGRQSQATDNISIQDVSGVASLFAANGVIFDGMFISQIAENGPLAGARIPGIAISACHSINFGINSDCSGDRSDNIRYDSPTIAGFTLSASWGEDDFWDVALRYAGELGDFKVLAGVGYTWRTDDAADTGSNTEFNASTDLIQGVISVMHTPTGLFVNVSALQEEIDIAGQPDNQQIYVKAGIRQKWNSLGATVLYGEYGLAEDAFNATFATATGAIGSEFERYGAGIVQEIDAAAMAVWVKWRRHEGEIDTAAGTSDLEELDMFLAGGVIFF